MKCPTIWLKARTEEYCVKPSKQNSFDVCLSRRFSPWTMWVLKSSKFYSCLKTFPPEDWRFFMLKIKKKNDTWKFALVSYFLNNCTHPYVVSWLYQCYKGQKNSKAKGPSQVSNVEKWKSTAFWTNFVHRMSPCSRFHTHTHTYTSLYSLTFTHLKSIFSSKNNFPWKCNVPFRFWKKARLWKWALKVSQKIFNKHLIFCFPNYQVNWW